LFIKNNAILFGQKIQVHIPFNANGHCLALLFVLQKYVPSHRQKILIILYEIAWGTRIFIKL